MVDTATLDIIRLADNYGPMRLTPTESGERAARRIAAEVRAEMARQGVSQQALADRLGWPQPRISRRLTRGELFVAFDVQELAAVAAALDVPVAQFLPEPETAEAAA